MAERVAVLMKLKDGVTVGEVRELCALLRRVGDPKWLEVTRFEETPNGPTHGRSVHDRAKKDEEIVTKYDDEHGDPCFYIP